MNPLLSARLLISILVALPALSILLPLIHRRLLSGLRLWLCGCGPTPMILVPRVGLMSRVEPGGAWEESGSTQGMPVILNPYSTRWTGPPATRETHVGSSRAQII